MPSSFPPSPSPIAPFGQRRSSFVQLPRASGFSVSALPCSDHLRSLGLSPNALFVQPRSAPELTPTAFGFLFPFRTICRMLRAQRRCDEVPRSTDLVPSLANGQLPPDWTLSSPRKGLYQDAASWLRGARHSRTMRSGQRNRDFSSTTGFPRAPSACSPKLALELVLRY